MNADEFSRADFIVVVLVVKDAAVGNECQSTVVAKFQYYVRCSLGRRTQCKCC
ncbi:unnamed protein product [Gongylonema pulchrum]|uniref:Uncharacterized protein n=1 Tax=Gongylonema pulchrum TaxID=637853 RepID=A0A183D3L8_9BILA|nr:unnamed protein product [Gongylonema pulchrum]